MKSIVKKINRKSIIIFYFLFIIVWFLFFKTHIGINVYKEHFAIPLTMLFGSFIAGFTSEGGGAVAFPIFSKVLHIAPNVVMNFSFAIQSVGMTLAAVTILLKGIKIEKNVLKYSAGGGIMGIIFGTLFIVSNIVPSDIKLIFTLIVFAFGMALFIKNFVLSDVKYKEIMNFGRKDMSILLLVGFLGGVFSSIVGTGTDIICFSFVTLFYRLDEKVATPTSVVIMASNSIFGFFLHQGILQDFSPEAFQYWALCIPIVAVFAPIGAVLCSKASTRFIVKFLLVLISFEFISTMLVYKFSPLSLLIVPLTIGSFLGIYLFLIKMSTSRMKSYMKDVLKVEKSVCKNCSSKAFESG